MALRLLSAGRRSLQAPVLPLRSAFVRAFATAEEQVRSVARPAIAFRSKHTHTASWPRPLHNQRQ